MLPPGGSIRGRLTGDLPLGCLQGSVAYPVRARGCHSGRAAYRIGGGSDVRVIRGNSDVRATQQKSHVRVIQQNSDVRVILQNSDVRVIQQNSFVLRCVAPRVHPHRRPPPALPSLPSASRLRSCLHRPQILQRSGLTLLKSQPRRAYPAQARRCHSGTRCRRVSPLVSSSSTVRVCTWCRV